MENLHWFDAIFKIFAHAVFEVIEVKRAGIFKQWDFEPDFFLNVKKSNIQLRFMSYGHFLARNGSKSTIVTQKLVDFIWFLRNYCWFWHISSRKMATRHTTNVGCWIFLHLFWFVSASKSRSLTMRPSLISMASKTVCANILKIALNQCKFSKDSWEVWIVGRGSTKTKCPQQWGVYL